MLIPPKSLYGSLPKQELAADKKAADRFESCSLGKKALYVGGFYLNNLYYIPLKKIDRVYKRLAVSKGFFESGKVFITVSYLVVEYDGGKQKTCRFTREENLDLLLSCIKSNTSIPVGKKK